RLRHPARRRERHDERRDGVQRQQRRQAHDHEPERHADMPRRHHDDDAGVLIRTSSAFRTLAAVVALPVVASACVPADAPPPHVTSTLDAALAEVARPALDYASAAFSAAGLVAPPIVPSRCPLESTTSSFVCAPLSGSGLTLNRHFALLDSAGDRQAAFDANT